MICSPFKYKWENILYGGLALLVVIDCLILCFNWANPILRATGILSIAAGALVFLGHLFDWEIKEWLLTIYIIPLLLLGAGGIDNYYAVVNLLLALGKEHPIPTPVPHADYGAELIQHCISLIGGPLVRLAAYLCRRYCS